MERFLRGQCAHVTVIKNLVTDKKSTLQSIVLSFILESVGGNDKLYGKSALSRIQTLSLSLRNHATDVLVAKLKKALQCI